MGAAFGWIIEDMLRVSGRTTSANRATFERYALLENYYSKRWPRSIGTYQRTPSGFETMGRS